MKISIKNVDSEKVSVVVEPRADEIDLNSEEHLLIEIDNPSSYDIEIVYGGGIISVYVPDCDGYKFIKL
jgi:hypothetical protein